MQGEESRVRIVPGPADRFAATARRLVQPAGDGRLVPRTPVPASRPRQNRSSPGRPSTARSSHVPGRDSTPARPRAAARPAGFMAGHRPTCGRNQAAEHAHDQATRPAPFDATARATPGFRPPASPEPPQPGRRADERGSPLSCSPPSRHRIAARPAPHVVLGLPLPAQDHGETAEMLRLRPGPRRLLAPLRVTAGADALHGSFLARCGRPRTIPCDRRTCRRRSRHSVPAGSRSKEGDNPALRRRGNRPSGLRCRDRLNGCPFLFSFGGSRPPSCLGRPLARLSRIIYVIRNAPGQSGPDRGYSRAQPRRCVVYLDCAWPVAALRFPYYSTLYGIKKGSRRCVVPTAPCVLVGQRL